MDIDRFDALARSLTTGWHRRRLLAALGAALAPLVGGTGAEAHDPLQKCKKKSGKQKKTCVKKAKAHNAQHASTLSPPPTGCPAGTRTCADGRCVQAGGCCTDPECGPGTCGSDGTCDCGLPSATNPYRVCPATPGRCSICCDDTECATGTTCRNGACRCPSGGCDCAAAVSLPDNAGELIACGSNTGCFCFMDKDTVSTAQCGVFEPSSTCSNCASGTDCQPFEFCGFCVTPATPDAEPWTCITACAVG
jgi:hypothetical protein